MKIYEYTRASADHPERDEDSYLTFPGNGKAPVFVMIDGMGGHQRTLEDGTMVTGREAATLVRETFVEDLQHLPVDADASPGSETEQKVIAALRRAHNRVLSELNAGAELPLNRRVGAVATVTVVCENGKRLLTGQVGDTRGYLLTEGELIQLCYDEDNVEYLVGLGMMSAEDGARVTELLNSFDGVTEPRAEGVITINGNPYDLYIAWRWFLVGNTVLNIPGANIVINALGVNNVDPKVQLSRIELSPGDVLFLCSDGAYKNLTEGEMTDFLLKHVEEDAATIIGEAAYARSIAEGNRRATKDDVTVVVVRDLL